MRCPAGHAFPKMRFLKMAEQTQQNASANVKKKGKVIDTWKTKNWYSVIAPEMFEQKEVGKVASGDEENLKNRVIRIGLDEVAGMSQSSVYTRLDLRVREVKGKNVYTNLIGHELIPGYVKTIIRRRKSLITSVADATTTDGKKLRMKYLIVTGNRVSDKVKTMVRNEITKELLEAASTTDFASIMQELIFGKIQKRIYAKIKMFAPIKRIEIRRTELVETFA